LAETAASRGPYVWSGGCGGLQPAGPIGAVNFPKERFIVSSENLVQDLIEAGVHFGHRASRWNPKMRPYIYGRKNLIHIIDVRETVRGLLRAKKLLKDTAAEGGIILFVGTKRQAAETIEREASRCEMPYIGERWLGGTLTNFRTIRSRLGRLEELESMRQSDEISAYSKKMQSALNREYRKMYRNLNGMRTMNRIPNCIVVVDPKKEKNAVREASKLGVTTVALIDTDCDPDIVDLPIPGNDDGIRSIDLIVTQLADAVTEGNKMAAANIKAEQELAAANAAAAAELAAKAASEQTAEAATAPSDTAVAVADQADTGGAGDQSS
jgi:small subunit ribosomal protein S2